METEQVRVIQVENPINHAPLLIGSGVFVTLLELSHIRLPLLLSWQGSQTSHRRVPVKVKRSLDNHEQPCSEDIDFHFQNTHRADALLNLVPKVVTVVRLLVFPD